MVNHIFFWKVALVVFLNQQHNPYAVPSLSLCSSPVKHQNCILQCSDSAVSFLINFDHPSGVLQGSCPIAGDNSSCASANYTIYQSLPHTFLSISSLDRNRDEGEWQCTHGVSNSNLQKLSVPSPLGIQKTPLVTMSDVEIEVVCEMSCQYPTANVSVEVIYAEEDKSNYQSFPSAPTIVTDFTDKTNCDSYEINYKARFTFTKSNISNLNGKKLKFKCNFTHAIIQSSTGDTGPVSEIIEVKDEETTTTIKPSEGKLTPGAIAGIVIGVVAGLIIIFVFVYFCIIKKKKGCTHCPCCKQDVKTPGNTYDKEDFASKPIQNPLSITNTTTKPPVKLQPLATKDKNHTPLDNTEEQNRKKKKKKQKQVHNKDETKVVHSDSENTRRKQDDTTGTMNENHQPYGNDDMHVIKATHGKQETLTILNVDNEKNKTGIPYEKHETLTAIHIDNKKNKTGIAYEKHEKPTAIHIDNENNKIGISYEKHEKLTAIHIDNENNKTGIAYEKHEKPTAINIDNGKI